MDTAALAPLRREAIDELLFRAPAEAERRHQLPAVDGMGDADSFDFIEVLRMPKPEIGDWSRVRSWNDLCVRKACHGYWRSINRPEMALLELARDLPGVATYLGHQFAPGPDGRSTELFTMAYRGPDLEKWQMICLADGTAHVDPFKAVEFWLALTLSIIERALLQFHSHGFVHCDLKPDNLCVPPSEVEVGANDVKGYIDLAHVALIDLGASLGPSGSGTGGESRQRAPFRVQQGETDATSIGRYVSEAYLRHMAAGESGKIDGRIDLYSLAYWLRRMLHVHDAAAMGDGPWPRASLRSELRGDPKQREFLARLPGLIWQSADNYRDDPEQLPHAALGAQIRRVMPVVRDRWFFRVPLILPDQVWAQNAVRAGSALLSVMQAERPDLHRIGADSAAGATPVGAGRSAPTNVYRSPATRPPAVPPPPLPSPPAPSTTGPRRSRIGLWLVAGLAAAIAGGWLIQVAVDAKQDELAANERAQVLEKERNAQDAAKATEAARMEKLRGFADAINALRLKHFSGPERAQACDAAHEAGNPYAAICLGHAAISYLPESRQPGTYAAVLESHGFDASDRADLETIAANGNAAKGHLGALSLLALDASCRADYPAALRLARAAAEEGDALAMGTLGWLLLYGKGVDKDPAQSLAWYRRAAKTENPHAWSMLGFLYASGQGVAQDEAAAREWYRKAADVEWTQAMVPLALMLLDGRGGDADRVEAVQLLRKSADLGSPEGMYQFALLFRDGRGVDRNPGESVRWTRRSAEAGYGPAMQELGAIFEAGRGDVAADPAEAVAWYRKAAEMEVATAMTQLGRLYRNGTGVGQDYAEAIAWFRKAIKAGDTDGAFYLGYMYSHGLGIEQDKIEAVRLYRQVAESGNPIAMFNLALLFRAGEVIERNDEEAARLYRKAAAQGHLEAMNNLAIMHVQGEGVKQDLDESFRLTLKSAEGGNPYAMFNLGAKYDVGEGVELDSDAAVRWWMRAARSGNASAQKILRERDIAW
jgi:TPR repeat protein/serine/threonine protein kinase